MFVQIHHVLDFNEPTKTLIRQLFFAEAKKMLGRVRGKFGGIVGPPEAERTMDYETLISEGNEERKEALERLEARLQRLTSSAILERPDYRDWETDRKSTRLNSSHSGESRMPSSA